MQLTQKQLEQIKNQYRLSPRETQIVDLILKGVESNESLSKNLGVTLASVKNYVHIIHSKMATSTKAGIILKIIDSIHN